MKITEQIESLINDKYCKITDVRQKIKELENRDDYSEWINKLRQKELFLQDLYKSKEINLIKIKKGEISIGGRPGKDKIEELNNIGISTIVSLLKKDSSKLVELGEMIQSYNIEWIWLPFSASKLKITLKIKQDINYLYDKLIDKLNNGEKIFIHCDAGVHRTGAFVNGLLLKMAFSKEKSKELIYDMRPITAIEAVTRHWNWSMKIIN